MKDDRKERERGRKGPRSDSNPGPQHSWYIIIVVSPALYHSRWSYFVQASEQPLLDLQVLHDGL